MAASTETDLGCFSVSLAVKDLGASLAFYEKLGFSCAPNCRFDNWAIVVNGGVKIGLFQGMFDKNILTFNPGWDANAQPVGDFTDVRALQAQLEASGIEFESRADPNGTGPASFVIHDPDGNPILVDQHL